MDDSEGEDACAYRHKELRDNDARSYVGVYVCMYVCRYVGMYVWVQLCM